MKLLDISWPISKEMTSYHDRDSFTAQQHKTIALDGVKQSLIGLDTHTGTHIDFPNHVFAAAKGSSSVNLDALVGPCRVLDFSRCKKNITAKHLAKYRIRKGERILLKTKNSKRASTAPFDPQFIYLEESGARYLAQKHVALVGIDYLGLEHSQAGHPSHKALLGAGIIVLEGLRLAEASAKKYTLLCLPLALKGLEASPARAVLVTGKV